MLLQKALVARIDMKKKMFLLFLFIGSSALFGYFFLKTLLRSEFISATRAEKKWGIEKFNSKKFKISTNKNRAAMAVYILKHQLLKGKNIVTDIRELLGEPDSYFFTDSFIGYTIQERTGNKKNSWQLVFFHSGNGPEVMKIKINKQCCYKMQGLLDWVLDI